MIFIGHCWQRNVDREWGIEQLLLIDLAVGQQQVCLRPKCSPFVEFFCNFFFQLYSEALLVHLWKSHCCDVDNLQTDKAENGEKSRHDQSKRVTFSFLWAEKKKKKKKVFPVRATNGNTTLNGNTPIFFPQVCPPWWFINWFDLT